jgi:hypothetical protein
MNLKPEEVFLGQGTLRPDLIESASHLASGKADVIKTHHNDSELIRQLRDEGRVVEPLKDFHKDEVQFSTWHYIPKDHNLQILLLVSAEKCLVSSVFFTHTGPRSGHSS